MSYTIVVPRASIGLQDLAAEPVHPAATPLFKNMIVLPLASAETVFMNEPELNPPGPIAAIFAVAGWMAEGRPPMLKDVLVLVVLVGGPTYRVTELPINVQEHGAVAPPSPTVLAVKVPVVALATTPLTNKPVELTVPMP
jgi:hypothetical protein